MTPAMLDALALTLDPSLLMGDLGLTPDPWQTRVLRSSTERLLLLCARQCGKSTVTACLALHTALYQPGSLTVLVSPSQRQSGELFRKVGGFYAALGRPLGAVEDSATTLSLGNGSRVVSLPGSPATIRGFSDVRLLAIDEAALTGDDLFIATSPMRAVGRGRIVCLSTPLGRRGWFFEQWDDPLAGWERVKATAWDCPRISRGFLEGERRSLGDRWFRQEYECSFEEAIGQVFSTASVEAAFAGGRPPLPFGSILQ
jgi:hypothetical protein